jgi:hypothetical protein
MRTRFELADAVKLFAPALVASGKLSSRQQKTLNNIILCRTAVLGGHEEECDNCGAVAVLHTWGQNLSLHPHVYCIVPSAGYTLDGRWKNIGNDGKLLYPVQQLSACFKSKMLDSLKRGLRKSNQLMIFNDAIQKAYLSPWVVHCEPSLAGADHVVRYLGQYTHRVAITNERILSIADGKVRFIAKDYTDRGIKKVVKLDGNEFIRRFALHILPIGFIKIRYFGIYNHTLKRSLKLVFTLEDKPQVEPYLKKQQWNVSKG